MNTLRQLRIRTLENSLCLRARIRRKLQSRPSGQTILLVPPAEPNSLGDEAMVAASVHKFRRMGYTRIIMLNYAPDHCWKRAVPKISEEIAYGGLFTARRLAELKRLLADCSDASGCMLIGADVMDGGYGDWHAETKLTLLRFLAKAGIPTVVAGFSFKENASPGATQLFKGLPQSCKFFLRDNRSLQRFREATQLNAQLTVDLAFGFKESPTATSQAETHLAYLDWVKEVKAADGLVIAFCPNMLLRKFLGSPSLEDFHKLNHDILVRLLENIPSAFLVLLAHDSRAYGSDKQACDPALVERLYSGLKSIHRNRIFCYGLPDNAAKVHYVCETLDFAITGRMHFAIACLRAAKPVASIEFQNKVTGLMQGIFALETLVVPLSVFSNAPDFVATILPVISKRHDLEKSIQSRLPEVIKTCDRSFDPFDR